MSKEVLQPILVFAIGVVAIVMVVTSWALVFPTSANSFTFFLYAAVYLLFGIIVGLFWRNKSIYGGVWMSLPLILLGIVSVLISGFGSKFVSDDLPRLATVVLAGTIGCYIGQRLRSHHSTGELD